MDFCKADLTKVGGINMFLDKFQFSMRILPVLYIIQGEHLRIACMYIIL